MKKRRVVFSLCLLITSLSFIQLYFISKSTIPDYQGVESGKNSVYFHNTNQLFFTHANSARNSAWTEESLRLRDISEFKNDSQIQISQGEMEIKMILGQDTSTMYANTNSNVRSGPGTDYRRIGGVRKNEKVIVTGVAENGWYQVDYCGQTGYICDRLLVSESDYLTKNQVVSNKSIAPVNDTTSKNTIDSKVENIQTSEKEVTQVTVSVASSTPSSVIDVILQRTNAERAANGLAPLTLDSSLTSVANLRASECAANSCFSHTRPDGTPWYTAMDVCGVKYSFCAENLALSSNPNEDVVALWMGSTGHRDNILSPNVTKIGIGYAEGSGGSYFVQSFSN